MLTTDKQAMERLTGIGEWVMDEDIPPVVGGLLLDFTEAFTRTRWVAAEDMVGIMELADYFDVGRSTVTNWNAQRSRNGMPLPVAKLGATPVYSLAEVVAWWKAWVPSKGAKAGRLPLG